MKTKLDCIPCLQRQAIHIVSTSTLDERVREHVLRAVMKKLLELKWASNPMEMAGAVNRVVRTILNTSDPYEQIKRESNGLFLELYPMLQSIVDNSDDPIRKAVELSIAGNIIDFVALKEFNLMKTVEDVTNRSFHIDDYETLRERLRDAKSLLLFADNAGEIGFDKLLLETILKQKPLEKIGLVVKGGPIVNDATLEDALYVRLNELPNIEFLEISNGDEETGPKIDSQAVREWIEEYEVVLSKGQANYEGLSEISRVFFMLLVKCSTIASDIGASINDAVLKYNP